MHVNKNYYKLLGHKQHIILLRGHLFIGHYIRNEYARVGTCITVHAFAFILSLLLILMQ